MISFVYKLNHPIVSSTYNWYYGWEESKVKNTEQYKLMFDYVSSNTYERHILSYFII